MEEVYYLELKEESVLKLPYYGPQSKRIYLISEGRQRELFIQRADLFTTNLLSSINELRNGGITEIRYFTPFGCLVRILFDEGKLIGEYSCKSKKLVDDLKNKLILR